MHQPTNKTFGALGWIVGVLLLVAGFGGSWGRAYGQTAGPTPTPVTSSVSIVKSVNPSSGAPGDFLTFTIVATNNGTVPINNVFVEDKFVSFLDIISVTTTKGTARTNGRNVRVDIGTLQPGESVTITVVTQIRRDAPPGAKDVNIATIEFRDPGTPPGQPTVISSNPVPIGVGQAPPSGLPDTGNATPTNWLLVIAGIVCCLIGSVVLWRSRQAKV